jgi:hypothetical protein
VALTRKRGDDKDKARALVMIKLWLQVTGYMGVLGKERAGLEDGKDGVQPDSLGLWMLWRDSLSLRPTARNPGDPSFCSP